MELLMMYFHAIIILWVGSISIVSATDDPSINRELLKRAEYWDNQAKQLGLLLKELCLADKVMVEAVAGLRDNGLDEESLVSRAEYKFKGTTMNDADIKQKIDLIRFTYSRPRASASELGEHVYNGCLERHHITTR
jgi:hypothetical protein